jgi:hypothetical protein
MEGGEPTSETLTVRLPVRVKLSYEFENPYKGEKETQTKFSIDVKIFLTRDETEALDRELIDIMLQALNTIFETRKLEATEKTIEEVAEEIFDTGDKE